ncbi:hypothetical protein D3C87_2160400 [compost metagenome]
MFGDLFVGHSCGYRTGNIAFARCQRAEKLLPLALLNLTLRMDNAALQCFNQRRGGDRFL